MADVIKKVRIKKEDGTFTNYIPIGVDVANVITEDGMSIEEKIIKKPYYFNNVIDMKTVDYLKEGDCAITLGYYKVNDSGSSFYRIRTISNNDVIDETHVISLSNQMLVAELINPWIINPDNFVGENDTQKMQNAINYACNLYNSFSGSKESSMKINLSRIYNITEKLYINCNNKRLPFIFSSSNNGGFYSLVSGLLFDTEKQYISDLYFENITFLSTNNSGLTLIPSPKFFNVHFDSCTFRNIDRLLFTETYLQSISLDNCLITGGSNNFIEFCGSYYLNVTNCVVEHRNDKFFIFQNHSTQTDYNKQFYTNITNNLIEGFNLNKETGFINITGYELINICNNYFEAMNNLIVHDSKFNLGVLNIKNNRLYLGGSVLNKDKKGLLYLKPYSLNTFRMGEINFEGNAIFNTYAIFFDSEAINISFNFINYIGNTVRNDFNNGYNIKGESNNQPFNILPIVSLTSSNSTSKYNRTKVINNDQPITWEETFTINENDYLVYFTLLNGIFTVNTTISTTVSQEISLVSLYFGIDIYMDDLFSIRCTGNYIAVLNSERRGSTYNKYLDVMLQSPSERSTLVIATIQLTGRRG